MNYREMLDKFQEIEKRLQTAENIIRALEHRLSTLERPNFTPSWPVPGTPQPMWPREFWPQLYPNTALFKEEKQ